MEDGEGEGVQLVVRVGGGGGHVHVPQIMYPKSSAEKKTKQNQASAHLIVFLGVSEDGVSTNVGKFVI